MKPTKIILLFISIIAITACNESLKKNNHPSPEYGLLLGCNYRPFDDTIIKSNESVKLAPHQNFVWNKKELTCFYGTDDTEFIDTIMMVLKAWETCCGIRFIKTDDTKADIRVSFVEGYGCNSLIGNDADNYKQYSSMNLDPKMVTKYSEYWLINLYVLHEFGHAMGFIHEHQRADVTLNWDSAFVYKYFACLSGWQEEEVYSNIFNRYSFDIKKASEYDTLSIMHYDFPKFLTKDCKGYLTNWYLSEFDKRTALACYPM